MNLLLKSVIKVNDKDHNRCMRSCQFAEKVRGTYDCTLFNEQIDMGEDDEIGYGLKRTKQCLDNSFPEET